MSNENQSSRSTVRHSTLGIRHSLAWHGWQLSLPEDWSPVKIEGDWGKGSIVIADFHSSRLAVRWQAAPKKKFDVQTWAEQAIASEVGQLMLKKSASHVPGHAFIAGRLFVEPEPPGRDVWVGQSAHSNRLLEVVYQTKTVSTVLRDQILPGLSDQPTNMPTNWSIFDLSCTVPEGWTLKSQRLNAGDLTLSFGKKSQAIIVRQLAPASLALARQPLEKWLDSQQQIWKKMYRVKGSFSTIDSIQSRAIHRKRRFFMLRRLAKQRVTLAGHDVDRDRVVLVDAETAELAMQVFSTVGKAVG